MQELEQILTALQLQKHWPSIFAEELTASDLCDVLRLEGRAHVSSVLKAVGLTSMNALVRVLNRLRCEQRSRPAGVASRYNGCAEKLNAAAARHEMNVSAKMAVILAESDPSPSPK